jgi:hypothetical protein
MAAPLCAASVAALVSSAAGVSSSRLLVERRLQDDSVEIPGNESSAVTVDTNAGQRGNREATIAVLFASFIGLMVMCGCCFVIWFNIKARRRLERTPPALRELGGVPPVQAIIVPPRSPPSPEASVEVRVRTPPNRFWGWYI